MAVAFPASLRQPRSVLFALQNSSRSGGVALNGMEQTVSSAAERWRAQLEFRIKTTEQILEVRAWVAALDGRAGEVLLPVFDGRRANWPEDTWGRTLHPRFTRRWQLDGTAYEDPEIPAASAIIATVAAGTPRGSTAIGIDVTQGEPLRAGQYFSIANRLYIITAITNTVGTIQVCNIRPRTRAVAVTGDPVVLDRPVATMKLASDDQGELMLDGLRFADLSLSFVEAF